MKQRLKMGKIQPAAYKAMDALDQFVGNSSIDPFQQELIRIRASQINGCAYCVHAHTQDALKLGSSDQKLNLICVWKEAKNMFSEQEQSLLEMTEAITLIHREGLNDEIYERAIVLFGEVKTAQVIMAIICINAWNRIGVGLKMQPDISL